MNIISSFGALYDKTLDPAFAKYTTSLDAFEVHEQDKAAITKLLRVEQNGASFVSFNNTLVQGMGDITEKRSSLLKNYDCDGVALKEYQGIDGLVFSELKSEFSIQSLYKAFRQMTYSFLKMHAMLSLCENYNVGDMSLHFIAACQCFEDRDKEDGIYNRLSKEEQEDNATFVSKFMRRLIDRHNLKVKFGDVTTIWNLPLNDDLTEKEVTLSLLVTQHYGDNSLVYTY